MGGGPQISSEKKNVVFHHQKTWSLQVCLELFDGLSWFIIIVPIICQTYSKMDYKLIGAQGNPENSYVFQVGVFVLRRVACSWTIWITLNIECKKKLHPKISWYIIINFHKIIYSFRLFMDIRNFGETQMFIKVFPLKLSLADEFVTIALKRPARAACLQNIATRGISLCLFSDCWFLPLFYHVLPCSARNANQTWQLPIFQATPIPPKTHLGSKMLETGETKR